MDLSKLSQRTSVPLKTYPTAHSLILEESVFKLKTPTSTTLEGTIEWPSQGLDQRVLVLDIGKGDLPLSFSSTED